MYEFWTDYENFPLFMSNVREVRDLGGGRSHWVVRGPGGLPIEWDAVLTEQVPGEILAWRSSEELDDRDRRDRTKTSTNDAGRK